MEENEFDPGCERGEYYSFIQNRLNKVIDLPYIFVICAINHKNFTPRMEWIEEKDISKQVIRNKDTGKIMNFKDVWDENTQLFVDNLRKYILNSKWFIDNHSESKKIKS